jgi:hypothetical protein
MVAVLEEDFEHYLYPQVDQVQLELVDNVEPEEEEEHQHV